MEKKEIKGKNIIWLFNIFKSFYFAKKTGIQTRYYENLKHIRTVKPLKANKKTRLFNALSLHKLEDISD